MSVKGGIDCLSGIQLSGRHRLGLSRDQLVLSWDSTCLARDYDRVWFSGATTLVLVQGTQDLFQGNGDWSLFTGGIKKCGLREGY